MNYSVLLAVFIVYICAIKTVRASSTTESIGSTRDPDSCITIDLSTGTVYYIQSHNGYDGNTVYDKNTTECWIIRTSGNNFIVKIQREYKNKFNLQHGTSSCIYDKLEMQDLTDVNQRSINFCGENALADIHSSGRYMLVRFTTDDSIQCKGFQLRVQQVDKSNYDQDEWNEENYFYGHTSGECSDKTTSTSSITSTPTTIKEDPDRTNQIIGGVFGAVILIVLVVFGALVIFVCYKKVQKTSSVDDSSTRHETGPRLPGVTNVTE